MTRMCRSWWLGWVASHARVMGRVASVVLVAGVCAAGTAGAQVLTADRAVEIAIQSSPRIVGARAGVQEAKGSVYGTASGIMPDLFVGVTRSGSFIDNSTGQRFVGNQITSTAGVTDVESYTTTPTISSSWNILNLSSIAAWRAARTGLDAAKLSESAARNDVALLTRRQFYEVVNSVHLAVVAVGAVRLARDDERRVRALYEVGSVSKSDLLRAQVRRSQGEVDSLTAFQQISINRILLANQMGVPESSLGEIDTVLTLEPRTYDEAALMAEAERARPDLRAAEADARAAHGAHKAAKLARLPFINLSGSLAYNPTFDQTSRLSFTDSIGAPVEVSSTQNGEDDREWRGSVSLNWNLFDLGIDSRIASTRGSMFRADDNLNSLRRDVAHEVHQALIDYTAANERYRVAESAVASATENLNLNQQKYNVGSATILDLIDSQVALQRAQSEKVTALASIRVAEARIDRARGHQQ